MRNIILPHKRRLMILNFSIPGNPIAKMRPRFSKWGTYDPQSLQKREMQLHLHVEMLQKHVLKPLEDEIYVSMRFYMPIPNSWSQKRKKSMIGKNHCKKPDLDNFAKMYLDAMNTIVFKDNSIHCI